MTATRLLAALGLLLLAPRLALADGSAEAESREAVGLKASHKLTHPKVNESSGIVASRTYAGLYWTHNDSGDGPTLYPITESGEAWPGSPEKGIQVAGARNVDWEDIATDDSGNLIIADVGNNENKRRDLTLYYVPEPEPETSSVAVRRAVRIAWPEQEAFPPARMNFDCEAVFWADGRVHLLTKHRSDDQSVLHRLDEERPFPQPSTPVIIGRLDAGGQVTAADVSPDGLRLAVLTYGSVLLFERSIQYASFLDQPPRRLRIRAWQCEGICFEPDGIQLRITNEQRDIYRLAVSDVR